MIFETIISTINKKGEVNFAPFGIKRQNNIILLSPYIPSKTLINIMETREASVNYVDDSSFFVNCIMGEKNFKKKKCLNIEGYFLKDALAHDEIVVESIKEDKIRPTFKCRIINKVDHKRFQGFNRAHGSIIEACILASRVKILKKSQIINDLNNLTNPVTKTAGKNQKKNWNLIKNYILNAIK